MLTLVLLLSAAIIIPHLLIRQLQDEEQLAQQRRVSWAIYAQLQGSDYDLRCSQRDNAILEFKISSSHRISKRTIK